MKSPEWRQKVLLICKPGTVDTLITPAFGAESELVIRDVFETAAKALEDSPFHVLIADEKTFGDSARLFELLQLASQMNQRLTSILLVSKLDADNADFAKKCGATMIMDRRAISVPRIRFVIKIMRKRTFRTIVGTDIKPGIAYPAALYCYLPVNNRYAPLIGAGETVTEKDLEKWFKAGPRHLYVFESEFPSMVAALGPSSGSVQLDWIRERFRQTLIEIFDLSTSGMPAVGKQIYDSCFEIVERLEKIVADFGSVSQCLQTLPFPRWSAIAHGINSAFYTLVFGKECGIKNAKTIALAALLHNIGLCDVPQEADTESEKSIPSKLVADYQKHVDVAIALLLEKRMSLSPLIKESIRHHHECYDGTGFPDGLSLEKLPIHAALLSIAGSYDHIRALKAGKSYVSANQAWAELIKGHREFSVGMQKFHPELLKKISPLFSTEAPNL